MDDVIMDTMVTDALIFAIHKYMKDKKLTGGDIAKKLDISPMTLSRLLTGKTKFLQPKTWDRLQKILGISENDVYTVGDAREHLEAVRTLEIVYRVLFKVDGDYSLDERLKIARIALEQFKGYVVDNSVTPAETRLLLEACGVARANTASVPAEIVDNKAEAAKNVAADTAKNGQKRG